MNTWETLGIAATQDAGAIRKAYAARVKQWRPDTHPQEFVQLRDAYERALHWARRAVREAAEEEAAAPQEPAASPQDAPPSPEPGAVSQASIEPPPATAADDAPAPAPAPHVLIRELAHCYSTRGEQQAVLLLREQLAAVSQQTIDARLDWEAVLLESFLAADTPPLALLFEGERLLGWRERGMDVTQMCGHEGAQRLLLLVEMAQEAAFLRFFSHNRWQRRLFGTVRVPWFGMANQVQAARATVQLWTRWAQEAGSPSLRQLLDARVLRRLGGLGLLSTDVLFALLAALLAWPEVQDAVFAQKRWSALAAPLLTFALVLPLPLLGRWLWETRPVRQVRGWHPRVAKIPLVARAIVLGVLLIGGAIAWDAGNPPGVRIAGGIVLFTAGAVAVLLLDLAA